MVSEENSLAHVYLDESGRNQCGRIIQLHPLSNTICAIIMAKCGVARHSRRKFNDTGVAQPDCSFITLLRESYALETYPQRGALETSIKLEENPVPRLTCVANLPEIL